MSVMILSPGAHSMLAEIVVKIRSGYIVYAPKEPSFHEIQCWWAAYCELVGHRLIKESSSMAYPPLIDLTEEGDKISDILFPNSHPKKS